LPLEIEWEWFARGGQKALNEGTFDRYFSNGFYFGIDRDYDSDYESGSGEIYKIRDVGQIRPNQLGIYDCCKNFTEWCYDTVTATSIEDQKRGDFEVEEKTKIKNGKIYVYNAKNNQDYNRRIRGGYDFELRLYSDLYSEWYDKELGKFVIKKSIYRFISMFRVVRSIKKIQKASNTLKNIERISSKKEFKNMVFVKGGKYKPSFLNEEKEVFDIEVCKYITTQKMWLEVKEYNSAKYKGENKPIGCVGFWRILSYCNKLSIKYGLEPVYDLSKCEDEILMIRQLNGKIVPLNEANFKDTEGFRLPTEVEWEWFARGGQKALDEETFDYTYSGSNNIDEVAWYRENSGTQIQDVGLKKPNQLGLYDCSGNVWEWCNDTSNSPKYRMLKGGSWYDYAKNCTVLERSSNQASATDSYVGFRLVRTV
ncbi:MAG: SUMF1/EgtB/PvdO family nonheme iron enzyme, partial [Fusobacterium periodonticum]|nr:SUMF1/EgtB/PvdO family nonheme iron enzyme [Fusobacterium periodonticum]